MRACPLTTSYIPDYINTSRYGRKSSNFNDVNSHIIFLPADIIVMFNVILIILVVIIAVLLGTRMIRNADANPCIWKDYVEYMRSGHRKRIDKEKAIACWKKDAQRWEPKNNNPILKLDGLSVCTWNVHTWKQADDSPMSSESVEEMIAGFDESTKVLCLQEFSQPSQSIKALLDRRFPYKFVSMNSPDFGSAIYSTIPLREERNIDLPSEANHDARIAQRVTLAWKDSNVVIYNLHLEVVNGYPYLHEYRYPQIYRVLEDAGSLGQDAKIIIAGDFNTGDLSREDLKFHITLNEHGFSNAKYNAEETRLVKNSSIYGGFVDHIYYRNIRPLGCWQYFTDASDHYPMQCLFRSF